MDTTTNAKDLPASLVFEAVNSRVVVETIEGSIYKGKLAAYDTDKGNVELTDARYQAKDSSYEFLERVAIRGASIRTIQLPPEMKAAPSLQWRRDSVQQELKKTLKRAPVLRPKPVVAAKPKKTPLKVNKGKQLRRKLR